MGLKVVHGNSDRESETHDGDVIVFLGKAIYGNFPCLVVGLFVHVKISIFTFKFYVSFPLSEQYFYSSKL